MILRIRDEESHTEGIIERPTHRLGIVRIYLTAVTSVLRCPSIYIATFLFCMLIIVVMTALYIGLGIIMLNALLAAPFFSDVTAGVRFFLGFTYSFILILMLIFGFLVVLLKSGQAGMFVVLHQGGRPRLADFSLGIGRYSWKFLKGYFHFAALMIIPMLINYGLIILRFGSYSTHIFTHGLNRGLRVEFINSIHTGEWIVLIVQGIVFFLLFVWDESVVLEGSTFQKSFHRSFKFVTKNPLRVLLIGVANWMIITGVFYLIMWSLRSLIGEGFRPTDPGWSANLINSLLVREFWFFLLMLLVMPILAYTHYLLYIPSRPFGSMKITRRPKRMVSEPTLILENDTSFDDISFDGTERDDSVLRLDE